MAHSKSSKKRIVIGERNRLRNQAVKSRVKTFVKKVLVAVDANNVDEATTALNCIKENPYSRAVFIECRTNFSPIC